MCIAIPMAVEEIEGPMAIAQAGGLFSEVNIDLVPKVKQGDFVLVHAGFAIQIIDENMAKESWKLWSKMFQK